MDLYGNNSDQDTQLYKFLKYTGWLKRFLQKQMGYVNTLPADDLIARQRYQLFTWTTGVASLVILYAFFHALSAIKGNTLPALIIGFLDLVLIANFLSLPYHRKHRVAYLIIVLASFFTLHVIAYFSGGLRASAILYMAGNLLIAFMLLGNRAGKMVAIFIGLHVCFFWYFQNTNLVSYALVGDLKKNPGLLDDDYLTTFLLATGILAVQMHFLESKKNIVINRITIQRDELREKNRELKKLSIVASKADNAILITDSRGVVEWVNDGFVRLTGYQDFEVIGKKPFDLLHGPATDQGVRAELREAIARKEPFSGELLKYRKDGTTFWTQITMTSIMEEDGEQGRFIFIESDITTRKLAEEKMNLYMHDLQKINKELDKFANVLSHEMKAPLRAIGNLAGLIEEEAKSSLSREALDHFEKIQGRVVRMEHLINGIFNYTKAGRNGSELSCFNVSDLVRETVDLIGISPNVTVNIREGMPVITAERVKLQQVFMNLINNSVAFNDKEDVHVEVGATEHEGDWEFYVSDNGPGIDPRYHDKIFVIFQTLHARDDRETTGVGLAIVKKLIEDAGGRIAVDSRRGHGARFSFTWPKETSRNHPAELLTHVQR